MPLIDVNMSMAPAGLPSEVRSFLREADRRIRDFQRDSSIPAFVPSDYSAAYGMLHAVAEHGMTRGGLFCEWGSGFGVTACLAAMLGFDAFGIEIEPELVEQARNLAEDFDVSVEFVRGSFIPAGAEPTTDVAGGLNWLDRSETAGVEELGLATEDFDVIFAYPWPDEEPVIAELFDLYAGGEALLVTYHSGADFRVRQKQRLAKKPKRRGR